MGISLRRATDGGGVAVAVKTPATLLLKKTVARWLCGGGTPYLRSEPNVYQNQCGKLKVRRGNMCP
jgi:hypothetical protein